MVKTGDVDADTENHRKVCGFVCLLARLLALGGGGGGADNGTS